MKTVSALGVAAILLISLHLALEPRIQWPPHLGSVSTTKLQHRTAPTYRAKGLSFVCGSRQRRAQLMRVASVEPSHNRIMSLENLLQSTDPTVELQGEVFLEMMRAEARELVSSPVIGRYVNHTILQAEDLPDAMARIILSHMRVGAPGEAPSIFDPEAVTELITSICSSSPSVRRGMIADLTKTIEADFVVESVLQPFINFKGLHAVSLARIARNLWKRGTPISRQTALALQSHGSMQYGIDIHPAAQIGDGVFVDHATGLVIGATAIVGDNVLILHGVTLGATGKRVDGKRHPTVGSGSSLGALSTVLGDITIGDEATVGAQAVVTKDVMMGETVVGINKVLDGATKRQRMLDGYDEDTWFYNI